MQKKLPAILFAIAFYGLIKIFLVTLGVSHSIYVDIIILVMGFFSRFLLGIIIEIKGDPEKLLYTYVCYVLKNNYRIEPESLTETLKKAIVFRSIEVADCFMQNISYRPSRLAMAADRVLQTFVSGMRSFKYARSTEEAEESLSLLSSMFGVTVDDIEKIHSVDE